MKKIILSALAIVALIASCKKETGPAGANGTNGTNGNVPSGTIAGKVQQYDQYGVLQTTGLNTVSVSIDGTTNKTVTDATGNFTLSNVEPGVYNVSLQKPGCGLIKQEQVSFPGNGTLFVNSSVADKATFTFNNGYIKDTIISSTHQIKTNIGITPTAQLRSAVTIFGKTSSLDVNVSSSYDYINNFYIFSNSASYTSLASYNISAFNSYTSGQTIYVKIYPSVPQASGYYDYALGTSVYTGCGTPLPTTFTLTMP